MLNLEDASVKYSRAISDLAELPQTAANLNKELSNYLDTGLTKLNKLIGNDQQGIVVIGSKSESSTLLRNLEHVIASRNQLNARSLIDDAIENTNIEDFLPKKYVDQNTKSVYWDLTTLAEANEEIALQVFLFKILRRLKKCKVVLIVENIECFLGKLCINTLDESTVVVFSQSFPNDITASADTIRANIKSFLSASEYLSPTAKAHLEFLSGETSKLVLLNKSESDFVFLNPECKQVVSKPFELIESVTYVETSSVSLSKNLSVEGLVAVENIFEITNTLANKTIKFICGWLNDDSRKIYELLAGITDIQPRKESLDSLKCIHSIVTDLLRNVLEPGKENEFFNIVNEKIPILLDQVHHSHFGDSLTNLAFYYAYFQWAQADCTTKYYINLKAWITQIEEFSSKLHKVISREELKLKEAFFQAIESTKQLLIVIRNFYANKILQNYRKINAEQFMSDLNAFQAKITDTVKTFVAVKSWTNTEWLKMVDTLENELLTCFNIEFKTSELRPAFELKLAVNEYNQFELEFVKALDAFENHVLSDRYAYSIKCFADVQEGVREQIKVYKYYLELETNKEKSFKSMVSIKNSFDRSCAPKETLRELVESLKQVHPQIAQVPLIEMEKSLRMLYESKLFGFMCDKDTLVKEFVELKKSVSDLLANRCGVLYGQLIKDSHLHLTNNIIDLASCLFDLTANDSNKIISVYQCLSTYLAELNKSPTLGLTDIVTELRKSLTDEQSLTEKIRCFQIFDRLMHPDLVFISDNAEIKLKFLNEVVNLKKEFCAKYAQLLREKLNFVWSILIRNVENLKILEKKYVYDTLSVIRELTRFTACVCASNKSNGLSIVEILDNLKTIDETVTKEFALLVASFEFKAISDYLMSLMKSYNIQEIRILFEAKHEASLLHSLIKTLQIAEADCIGTMQMLAKNALLKLKADVDEKLQKIKSLEQYDDAIQFAACLLDKFETRSFAKDVHSFSLFILEKTEDFLSEDAKAAFELIKKDIINDAKLILRDFEKTLIVPLRNEIDECKTAIKTKNENLKIGQIKSCMEELARDINSCLDELKENAKCFNLLESSMKALRRIQDNPFKNIEWLCATLSDFWKFEKEKESFKCSIKTTEIASQALLDKLAREHFSGAPIPQAILVSVKTIYEQLKRRQQFYDGLNRENEAEWASKLKIAVDCFLGELVECLVKLENNNDRTIEKLIQQISESLKFNFINEIASGLCFNFEANSRSFKLFEDLKAQENAAIPFASQMEVKKMIQRSLEAALKSLDRRQKELQLKEVKDIAHLAVLDLGNLVNDTIQKEIEKPAGMKNFLLFLEKLKASTAKIDHDKISYFAISLDNLMFELNVKIQNLNGLRDKKLDFYPHTKKSIIGLADFVRRRLNWYRLLKVMFEKMNEGHVFDGPIDGSAEDSEYLAKLLRKLNVSLEKGVFTQLLSTWNQDLNEILSTQLDSNQKSELILLSEYASSRFDSVYDEETKHLVINGNFIHISNVIREMHDKVVLLVVVVAKNGVYFDGDVRANGVSFLVIAPWIHVPKRVFFDISGLNALEYTAKRAKDGSAANLNGENGLHGQDGQDAGHFCGIFASQFKIEHFKRISFQFYGGNGSNGQDGGDGMDGPPGRNAAPMHIGKIDQDIVTSFKTVGLFKKILQVFHRSGADGQTGGNAGHGGNAGDAGFGGRVTLLHDKKIVNSIGEAGKNGRAGRKGNPGIGGKHGNHYESYLDVKGQKWHAENQIIERGKAALGEPGFDGKVMKRLVYSNMQITTFTIKKWIQEVLDKKLLLEKSDILVKLHYDYIGKFYDELQQFVRLPDYF